jgi:predicted esterase
MKRRALLSLAATFAWSARGATQPKPLVSDELELQELNLPGDVAFGRYLLAAPKVLPQRPELVVLLHGLGETVEQRMGSRAFAERYGLLGAVARLTHPPLARTLPRVDYFGEGRLDQLNAALAARPYRCPVFLCPFTPNPYKAGGEPVVARFAEFVGRSLKSAVEARLGVTFPASRCMLSGVSLGGYLAIELFLKTPELYCAVGTAQGAFGPQQAARYAAGVAAAVKRVGPRRVELLTSSLDPYRASNEAFQKHLQRLGQASRLRVSPGPHDQRWLNESGVIEMLVAADDSLAERRPAGQR